jgi:hypothetical protein
MSMTITTTFFVFFQFLGLLCFVQAEKLTIQFLAFSDTHIGDPGPKERGYPYSAVVNPDLYIGAVKNLTDVTRHKWSDGSSIAPDFAVLNGDLSMDAMFNLHFTGMILSLFLLERLNLLSWTLRLFLFFYIRSRSDPEWKLVAFVCQSLHSEEHPSLHSLADFHWFR